MYFESLQRKSFNFYVGLEETKASLRNSQIFLDEIDFESKTLAKMENIGAASPSLKRSEITNLNEMTQAPYSTYSLPRNHR